MKKYWIIMVNDYPEGVATTEEDAKRMIQHECKKYKDSQHKVFIRAYSRIPNKNGIWED